MINELKFVKVKMNDHHLKIFIFTKQEGKDYYDLFEQNPVLATSDKPIYDPAWNGVFIITENVHSEIIDRLNKYGLIKYLHSHSMFNKYYIFKSTFLDSMPTSKEFFQQPIHNINIGDIVKVTNYGKTYASFDIWMGFDMSYIEFWNRGDLPENDSVCRVLNIDMHGHHTCELNILCLIQDLKTKKVFIINKDGVEKVDDDLGSLDNLL